MVTVEGEDLEDDILETRTGKEDDWPGVVVIEDTGMVAEEVGVEEGEEVVKDN